MCVEQRLPLSGGNEKRGGGETMTFRNMAHVQEEEQRHKMTVGICCLLDTSPADSRSLGLVMKLPDDLVLLAPSGWPWRCLMALLLPSPLGWP